MKANVKNLNPENSITFFKEGNLRIHSISKICVISDDIHEDGVNLYFSSLPVAYGVGIESTSDGGESYIVLSFVRPNAEGNKTRIEPVSNRVRKFRQQSPENAALYDKVKKMAKQIVEEALKEKGK